MEPKKVTAVYKRRPKKAEPQHPDRSSIGLGTTTGKESGIFVFRDEGYVILHLMSTSCPFVPCKDDHSL